MSDEANLSNTPPETGVKPEAEKTDGKETTPAGAAKIDGTLQGPKDKGGKALKAKKTNPTKGSKVPTSGKATKVTMPAKGAKTGKATKGATSAQTAKDKKGSSKGKTDKPMATTDACPFRPTASYGKLWALLHKHREKGISRANFIKEGVRVTAKPIKNVGYDVAVVASPTIDGKAHPSANRAADHYWVERTEGGLLKLHLR